MGTRNFHWDPITDCVIEETDQTGATLVRYTNEPAKFAPLLSENRGGTEYYHHYDTLGSTTFLTDDTGTVTDAFQYDAWGNSVARTGATATTCTWGGRWSYQFSALSNRYYVRARSYVPIGGRWESIDPLLTSRFANGSYGYCANDPTTRVDPSGADSVKFSFDAFISSAHGGPWFDEPGGVLAEFEGDNRGFGQAGTSRVSSSGSFDSCCICNSLKATNTVGTSHRRHKNYPYGPWVYDPPRTASLSPDYHNKACNTRVINYPPPCNGIMNLAAGAAYPYATLAPSIDYSLSVGIYGNSDMLTITVIGSHDQFPDYEFVIDGQVEYQYLSPFGGPGLGNLWWLSQVEFSAQFTLNKKTNCQSCKGTCATGC